MYDPRQRPAFTFMVNAHDSINQKRKYTGEPYWTHPLAVAEILVQNYPWVTPEMIDAALLHDVAEDTPVDLNAIEGVFGPVVGMYVDGLTERSYPGLNRSKRKALEAGRLGRTCHEVQTIKICDLLHNTADITEHDPQFAKGYMAEKRLLLDVGLRSAYPPLWKKADKYVKAYFKS